MNRVQCAYATRVEHTPIFHFNGNSHKTSFSLYYKEAEEKSSKVKCEIHNIFAVASFLLSFLFDHLPLP